MKGEIILVSSSALCAADGAVKHKIALKRIPVIDCSKSIKYAL